MPGKYTLSTLSHSFQALRFEEQLPVGKASPRGTLGLLHPKLLLIADLFRERGRERNFI